MRVVVGAAETACVFLLPGAPGLPVRSSIVIAGMRLRIVVEETLPDASRGNLQLAKHRLIHDAFESRHFLGHWVIELLGHRSDPRPRASLVTHASDPDARVLRDDLVG